MAHNCADLLIGGAGSERSKHAWIEVYRSVAHGTAKAACADGQTMPRFPSPIIDFANQFVEMQKKRHDADYNPYAKFYKSAVLNDISSCELVIKGFSTAGVKDRRAFASWVIFKNIKKN